MRKIIIATINPWNIDNARKFQTRKYGVVIVTDFKKLTPEFVRKHNPRYIFFPHWSWHIPDVIFKNYECVVFHMTDIPYGRGGSPLQNLIVRGHKKTKISAIKVVNELDAGPVYCKLSLMLFGTAEDILKRASLVIFNKMIPMILKYDIAPKPQKGQPEIFKRRKPEDGDLGMLDSSRALYDYIRMLDAPCYPKAFIRFGSVSIYFSKARLNRGKLVAEANFICQK